MSDSNAEYDRDTGAVFNAERRWGKRSRSPANDTSQCNGTGGIFVTYILLGIMLSIYRYQNVIAEAPFAIRAVRENKKRGSEI